MDLSFFCNQLKNVVDEHWLADFEIYFDNKDTLVIVLKDAFKKTWLERKYKNAIEDLVHDILGKNIKIEITHSQYLKQNIKDEKPLLFNQKYVFENFIVGDNNNFAYAAAKATAENPGKNYNPLFIYGKVGLGKTHLIQAIGNFIGMNKPYMKVVYIPMEKFMIEFVESIRKNMRLDFKARYREVDVLLVDDVHFLSGKEGTQEEFFYTFNALHDEGKQIVLTSDCLPSKLEGLEARLVSRFESGLVADIQPPDLETRIAILKQKIGMQNIQIQEDIVRFIALHIKDNVRELEGALNRVIAHLKLKNEQLDVETVKNILKDIIDSKLQRVSLNDICEQVGQFFNFSIDELCSQRRYNKLAFARQIIMYIAKEHFRYTLVEIGNYFKRDHTTVLHAYNKINQLKKDDVAFSQLISQIINKL